MVMLMLAMRCDAMRCDAIEEACGIRVVDGMGNNITCGVTNGSIFSSSFTDIKPIEAAGLREMDLNG